MRMGSKTSSQEQKMRRHDARQHVRTASRNLIISNCALVIACIILTSIGSAAQAPRPTGGVLLRPEAPQISKPSNGVLLRPQAPAILGGACAVNQLQLKFRTAD